MCTSNGSGCHSGNTATTLPSRSSVGADDLGGHGADAEALQDVLLAHLKVVGAGPHRRRQLEAVAAVDDDQFARAAEAEVDER